MAHLLHIDSSVQGDRSVSRRLTVALVDEIKNADAVLLGVPLYNFGPPSTVKAWVDHIVAPGLSIDAELTMADGNPAMADLKPLAADSVSRALVAIDQLWTADENAA